MNLTDARSQSKAVVKCVAVTKGRSVEAIVAMLERTSLTRIAENRLEEALEKFPHLDPALEKHFIGKLQSRKIPAIVELFDVIQSVENLEQAALISKQGKDISCFLQVNLNGESQRSGCTPEEAPALIEGIQGLPHLKLIGVMGMASPDPVKARREFRLLKSLQGDLPECSMGMSGDYKIALEEGSTMIRLGTRLFESVNHETLFVSESVSFLEGGANLGKDA